MNRSGSIYKKYLPRRNVKLNLFLRNTSKYVTNPLNFQFYDFQCRQWRLGNNI